MDQKCPRCGVELRQVGVGAANPQYTSTTPGMMGQSMPQPLRGQGWNDTLPPGSTFTYCFPQNEGKGVYYVAEAHSGAGMTIAMAFVEALGGDTDPNPKKVGWVSAMWPTPSHAIAMWIERDKPSFINKPVLSDSTPSVHIVQFLSDSRFTAFLRSVFH